LSPTTYKFSIASGKRERAISPGPGEGKEERKMKKTFAKLFGILMSLIAMAIAAGASVHWEP